MNYCDPHRLAWFAPVRTASRATGCVLAHLGFPQPHTHEFRPDPSREGHRLLVSVRDPFARLVSVYKWSLATRQTGLAFGDWLPRTLPARHHWLHYEWHLEGRAFTPLRVESLAADLRGIDAVRAGLDALPAMRAAFERNIAANPYSSGGDEYRGFFRDRGLALLVRSYFERQFALFGYDREAP